MPQRDQPEGDPRYDENRLYTSHVDDYGIIRAIFQKTFR